MTHPTALTPPQSAPWLIESAYKSALKDWEPGDPPPKEVIELLHHQNSTVLGIQRTLMGTIRKSPYRHKETRDKVTKTSLPVRLGRWWYFIRQDTHTDYPKYARTPAPTRHLADANLQAAEVYLDVNELAHGIPINLGGIDVAADGEIAAVLVDRTGQEIYSLLRRNMREANWENLNIPGLAPSLFFIGRSNSLFLIQRQHGLQKVLLLSPGEKKPRAIMSNAESGEMLSPLRPRSREFLFMLTRHDSEAYIKVINEEGKEVSELRIPREWTPIAIDHSPGKCYGSIMIAERQGNERSRLRLVNVISGQQIGCWNLDKDLVVEDLDLFGDSIVLSVRSDTIKQINVYRRDGAKLLREPIGSEYPLGLSVNFEADTDVIRVGTESNVRPGETRELDLVSMRLSPALHKDPAAATVSKDELIEWTEYANSTDGTKIPITVYGTKACVHSGATGIALTAYGAYGASLEPSFDPAKVLLMRRGVIFANAHIRGGGEMGPSWHLASKGKDKERGIEDLEACAAHLTGMTLAPSGAISLLASSAGGIPAAAVLNRRPALFSSSILRAPFLDLIGTLSDVRRPLTRTEWLEWGRPDDPEVQEIWHRICPLKNARVDQSFPPTLILSSLNDSRVLWDEHLRWIARLQDLGAPAVLMTQLSFGGHNGPSGRQEVSKLQSLTEHWMLTAFGHRSELQEACYQEIYRSRSKILRSTPNGGISNG